MARRKSDILPEGAIIEMIRQGAYVKVSAIDPVTSVEVSIVGDPLVGPESLKAHAIRKLERILKIQQAEKIKQQARPQEPPSGWDL